MQKEKKSLEMSDCFLCDKQRRFNIEFQGTPWICLKTHTCKSFIKWVTKPITRELGWACLNVWDKESGFVISEHRSESLTRENNN